MMIYKISIAKKSHEVFKYNSNRGHNFFYYWIHVVTAIKLMAWAINKIHIKETTSETWC